jgi:hypothetical protein
MHLLSWSLVRNTVLLSALSYICSIFIGYYRAKEPFAKVTASQTCIQHAYETVLVSTDPLVIYIRNFITEAETEHLLKQR